MDINKACASILAQLTSMVSQLSDQDFIKPANTLGGSTLGQHLRHTLEFFICLENGFAAGVINYDKRAHDKLVETDRCIALSVLSKVNAFVASNKVDRKLKLEAAYDLDKETVVTIETNYSRELVYNIEHAVHHMAMMKIGMREVAPYIELARDFGVAASTLRYQETVAQ
jgi:uncharacterized damage-inducible protein DinB